MNTLVMWLIALGVALSSLTASRSLMHYFQLESYQFPGYFRTLKRNFLRAIVPGLVLTVYLALLLLIHRSVDRVLAEGSVLRVLVALCAVALAIVGGWWVRGLMQAHKAKKPFVVTMRVKRTYITSAILFTLLCALIGVLLKGAEPRLYFIGLFPLLLPLWVALGGLCAWPAEKLVSEMYFRDAQKKLAARPDLIKIGITGSYGKTSVKFILGTILQEKFQVLVTPSSFNTPMGVTRIIREKLMPAHQVFVAEMGARHVGDIKEMCRLVHPHHGVLTSVGPQHLDTFHDMETIVRTKFELADSLPKDGMLFLNGDNLYIESNADRYGNVTFYRSESDGTGYRASDLSLSQSGTKFTVTAPSGESEVFQTKLVGAHNVINITGAIAVAHKMGIPLAELRVPVRRIRPVAHRMEMKEKDGVTIIDDAYNSNPVGSKAAVETMKLLDGVRILITPGMVELGDDEEEYNYKFGTYAAASCDYVCLIGRRHTEPIRRGLLDSGFPEEHLRVYENLEDAMSYARSIRDEGHKFILLENDLPDNY